MTNFILLPSVGFISEPKFNLNNRRYGLCVNLDGSRRRLRHAIAHENIAVAFQPIITSQIDHVPNLDDFPTVPVFNDSIQLPSDLALKIACFLGCADSLDALAATSAAFRAVARSHDAKDSILRQWLPSLKARQLTQHLCPRSLSRTFQRIQLAAMDSQCGWDAVLWQAAALGCIHGMCLAMEQGASIDDYSGGRELQEGPALWCAAKFNHLDAVKLLCEVGGANIEARGGIRSKSSPLWVAAREGNVSIMRYLISIGADPTSRNGNGRGCRVLNIAGKAARAGKGTSVGEMIEIIDLIRQRETTW